MKTKKSYLLLILIAAVVVVSGCAAQQQVDIIKTSFEKAAALEKGDGYTADYKMSMKMSPNDAFKNFLSKNPQATAAFQLLESNLNFRLSESIGSKGNSAKVVMDMTDLFAFQAKALRATGQIPGLEQAAIPKKVVFEIYTEGDQRTICVEFDKEYWVSQGVNDISGPLCVKGSEPDMSAIPSLGLLVSQYRQYSSYAPDVIIEKFAALYQKGLLSVGDTSKQTIAGRPCNSVPLSIKDLSKLSNQELMDLLSGLGSAAGGQPQDSSMSSTFSDAIATMLKLMVKDITYNFCFDSDHGVLQKTTAAITMDYTQLIKAGAVQARASAAGDAAKLKQIEDQEKLIPSNMGMTVSVDVEATSFKTPSAASDYSIPSGRTTLTAQEFAAQLAAGASAGLTDS